MPSESLSTAFSLLKPRRLFLGLVLLLAGFLAWRFELAWEPELLFSIGSQAPFTILPLPDGRFAHVFVHSVHKTPVEERFQIRMEGGRAVLHLHELRYQSQGAGMPSDAEGGYRLEAGTFILSMDRSFPELQIMVSPIGGHGILAGKDLLPFSDHLRPGQRVVLSARMTPRIRARR